MGILNVEFKARSVDIVAVEEKLLSLNPVFIGEDTQTDTYFNVPEGRVKLMEGNIENALIFYKREDNAAAKQSDILLYRHNPDVTLKNILISSIGIKVVVIKKRKIYFIDNVKFHFDTVRGLGTFIEVEAIDEAGNIGLEKLKAQCNEYVQFFDILQNDFIALSYSDMLLHRLD